MIDEYDGNLPKKYLNEFLDEFNLTMPDFIYLCEKFESGK